MITMNYSWNMEHGINISVPSELSAPCYTENLSCLRYFKENSRIYYIFFLNYSSFIFYWTVSDEAGSIQSDELLVFVHMHFATSIKTNDISEFIGCRNKLDGKFEDIVCFTCWKKVSCKIKLRKTKIQAFHQC